MKRVHIKVKNKEGKTVSGVCFESDRLFEDKRFDILAKSIQIILKDFLKAIQKEKLDQDSIKILVGELSEEEEHDNLIQEQLEEVKNLLESEGFDYGISYVSDFNEVKDEKFHLLREKYLLYKNELKNHLNIKD